MLKIEDLNRELEILKRQYAAELETLTERASASAAKLAAGGFSTHDAFNMAANTAELSRLAGKIEQTQNVLRWMEAK